MTVWSSGEYHRSLTVTIGRSLPILPASMVTVMRWPSASTPSIVCLPNDSVLTCPSPDQEKTPVVVAIGTPGAPATKTALEPLLVTETLTVEEVADVGALTILVEPAVPKPAPL